MDKTKASILTVLISLSIAFLVAAGPRMTDQQVALKMGLLMKSWDGVGFSIGPQQMLLMLLKESVPIDRKMELDSAMLEIQNGFVEAQGVNARFIWLHASTKKVVFCAYSKTLEQVTCRHEKDMWDHYKKVFDKGLE